VPAVVVPEPDELDAVVGDEAEPLWAWLAEVMPQAICGFNCVPDPAVPGLDDAVGAALVAAERFGAGAVGSGGNDGVALVAADGIEHRPSPKGLRSVEL
jgi:hypothetical protein